MPCSLRLVRPTLSMAAAAYADAVRMCVWGGVACAASGHAVRGRRLALKRAFGARFHGARGPTENRTRDSPLVRRSDGRWGARRRLEDVEAREGGRRHAGRRRGGRGKKGEAGTEEEGGEEGGRTDDEEAGADREGARREEGSRQGRREEGGKGGGEGGGGPGSGERERRQGGLEEGEEDGQADGCRRMCAGNGE